MPVDFPLPVVEQHKGFNVVRDDLVPGGTKQIVLRAYLPEQNAKHFVYAASAFGKGGAALAFACAEAGFKCTLLMARTDKPMSWIAEAERQGANIIWLNVMPVTEIETLARETARRNDAMQLPLGFADKRFLELMAQYVGGLPLQPPEIWCPVVSGTLATALEMAFPQTPICGVSVVKNPGYQGKHDMLFAAEKFIRVAASPPPYPSWPYSDAKIWRFAQKKGVAGAVIWNSNA